MEAVNRMKIKLLVILTILLSKTSFSQTFDNKYRLNANFEVGFYNHTPFLMEKNSYFPCSDILYFNDSIVLFKSLDTRVFNWYSIKLKRNIIFTKYIKGVKYFNNSLHLFCPSGEFLICNFDSLVIYTNFKNLLTDRLKKITKDDTFIGYLSSFKQCYSAKIPEFEIEKRNSKLKDSIICKYGNIVNFKKNSSSLVSITYHAKSDRFKWKERKKGKFKLILKDTVIVFESCPEFYINDSVVILYYIDFSHLAYEPKGYTYLFINRKSREYILKEIDYSKFENQEENLIGTLITKSGLSIMNMSPIGTSKLFNYSLNGELNAIRDISGFLFINDGLLLFEDNKFFFHEINYCLNHIFD